MGSLPLPQQASSGQCMDSAPVQFLRDSDSTCVRSLTQDRCADMTPFSGRVYVEPSSLYNPACPRAYTIRADGRLQGPAVNVAVNYYCATDISAYVKDSTTTFTNLVVPRTTYTFTSGLGNVNCTDLCGADASCLDYNQGLEDSALVDLPLRCPNDSSFELPDVPTYDSVTGICSSVVLDVRYNFTWQGQEITGLTADIILGNVQLSPGSETSISQKFSAVFVHEYSGPSNQTDNFEQQTTAYQRSGRPGNCFFTPCLACLVHAVGLVPECFI